MPFQFKEFSIQQDQAAMKVGTDGVLLGAWASLGKKPKSILDIGTGTGLIALQLAQRSDAEIIDAIEIEDAAFEEAVLNFEQSSWGDRLYCYHASLAEFVEEIEDKYDLIISNPPFYTEQYKSESVKRNQARFTDALPFEELISSVVALLSENGSFHVIIPFTEEENFVLLASKYNLFVNQRCRVRGNLTSSFKRSMLEFSFQKTEIEETAITIEIKRHEYTKEYMQLVKDFYLKM